MTQMLARQRAVTGRASELCELAVIVRDLARLAATQDLELAQRLDGLLPFLLALVNRDELFERGLGQCRAVAELAEELLRAVEQAGAQIVLGEREQRLMPLRFVEVRARQQILV